jgi:HAMP domain-containing protein
MTEETFVQLFWAIAIPTLFALLLAIGGAVQYLLEDPAMRHLRKMQEARQAWAKMLEEDRHERKA